MVKESKRRFSKEEEGGLPQIGETISKIEIFIEKNQKKLTYILLGIAVIVSGIFGYNKLIKQPRERQAYEEMFMAEHYFEIDSFKLALHGDGNYLGFLDIIDEYRMTKAGNLACYYVGIIYFQQKDYDNAIKYLKKFKSKDLMLSSLSYGVIGDAYVEKDNLKKAVKYYLKAAERSPNSFTSPIYLMRAAWTYEKLGNYKKALDIYLTIKEKYFRSVEAREIDKYISSAEARLKKRT